jgi:hypothetical protein
MNKIFISSYSFCSLPPFPFSPMNELVLVYKEVFHPFGGCNQALHWFSIPFILFLFSLFFFFPLLHLLMLFHSLRIYLFLVYYTVFLDLRLRPFEVYVFLFLFFSPSSFLMLFRSLPILLSPFLRVVP